MNLAAVLFCTALIPRVTGAAAASKLAEAAHPVACPPHWMPVLQVVASKEVRTTSRVRDLAQRSPTTREVAKVHRHRP